MPNNAAALLGIEQSMRHRDASMRIVFSLAFLKLDSHKYIYFICSNIGATKINFIVNRRLQLVLKNSRGGQRAPKGVN